MATYRGTDGILKLGGTAIGTIKSWTFETKRNRINTTSKGDDFATNTKGLASWSGSAELHLDFSDAVQDATRTAALSGADVALIFLPGGNTSGTSTFTGTAGITGATVNSPDPSSTDPVSYSVTFEGTGALAEANIP